MSDFELRFAFEISRTLGFFIFHPIFGFFGQFLGREVPSKKKIVDLENSSLVFKKFQSSIDFSKSNYFFQAVLKPFRTPPPFPKMDQLFANPSQWCLPTIIFAAWAVISLVMVATGNRQANLLMLLLFIVLGFWLLQTLCQNGNLTAAWIVLLVPLILSIWF